MFVALRKRIPEALGSNGTYMILCRMATIVAALRFQSFQTFQSLRSGSNRFRRFNRCARFQDVQLIDACYAPVPDNQHNDLSCFNVLNLAVFPNPLAGHF
jgi:hypothetical protein